MLDTDLSIGIKVGFTGTRHGMTDEQKLTVAKLLDTASQIHHGDCVGADEDSHKLSRRIGGIWIIIHPPTDPRLRAWCDGDETRIVKPYLTRNRDIVNGSDLLIATPAESVEQDKGGTWYTIRYARDKRKPVTIVWPDGSKGS